MEKECNKLTILEEIRINNKLTYLDMARRLDISKTFYWQIENGKRRLTYDMAKKISAIFKLKPDDIFYEEYN